MAHEYQKQQFRTYTEFSEQFPCDYSRPFARGGFGEIYVGIDMSTNEKVAIKRQLFADDDSALTLEKEYANTQAVPANNLVVRYLYYGRYDTGGFGTFEYLVMRFYEDGNMTSPSLNWQRLSGPQQLRFVREFLEGIGHLHRNGIIHRDIKPENILLVGYPTATGRAFRPIITDFGISKALADGDGVQTSAQNSMKMGTLTYMAPEQIKTDDIAYNADLWSFGVILYELITGQTLITRRTSAESQRDEAYQFWADMRDERFPADLSRIAEPYQYIVRHCLIYDSRQRVRRADELLRILNHQPQIYRAYEALAQNHPETAIPLLEPVVADTHIPNLAKLLDRAREYQQQGTDTTNLAGSLADAPTKTADAPEELTVLQPSLYRQAANGTELLDDIPAPAKPPTVEFGIENPSQTTREVADADALHRRRAVWTWVTAGVLAAALAGGVYYYETRPKTNAYTAKEGAAEMNMPPTDVLGQFMHYRREYAETGSYHPYLWAFIDCYPAYRDSLEFTARQRIRAKHEFNAANLTTYRGKLKPLQAEELSILRQYQTDWEQDPKNKETRPCRQ